MRHANSRGQESLALIDPDPILEHLKWIHRGHDGYVRFMKPGRGGGLSPIRSIRRDRLDHELPRIRDLLSNDAYVSINDFWRDGTGRDRDLRYLNAAYADCDAYGLDPDEAIGKTIAAQEKYLIPPPSVTIQSGRGIWLLWLLVQEGDPTQPEQAFLNKRLLYTKILKAINERLRQHYPELKPDSRALDTSRVGRLEGSFNSRAGEWVIYDWRDATNGYTLQELARFFGIAEPSPSGRNRQRRSRRNVTGRRRGWDALQEKILRDLKALAFARGGMPEGCRYHGALVLATVLRKLGRTRHDIDEQIVRYAGRCRPPMTPGEAHKATQGAERGLRWQGRTLANILNVKQEEVDRIGLLIIRPDTVPFRERSRRPRKADRAIRRKAICEIARMSPGICGVVDDKLFGVREITRRLMDRGVKASPPTVSRDLLALAKDTAKHLDGV